MSSREPFKIGGGETDDNTQQDPRQRRDERDFIGRDDDGDDDGGETATRGPSAEQRADVISDGDDDGIVGGGSPSGPATTSSETTNGTSESGGATGQSGPASAPVETGGGERVLQSQQQDRSVEPQGRGSPVQGPIGVIGPPPGQVQDTDPRRQLRDAAALAPPGGDRGEQIDRVQNIRDALVLAPPGGAQAPGGPAETPQAALPPALSTENLPERAPGGGLLTLETEQQGDRTEFEIGGGLVRDLEQAARGQARGGGVLPSRRAVAEDVRGATPDVADKYVTGAVRTAPINPAAFGLDVIAGAEAGMELFGNRPSIGLAATTKEVTVEEELAGAEAQGKQIVETGEEVAGFVEENPAFAAGALTTAVVTGGAAGAAASRGPNIARSLSLRARGGPIVDMEPDVSDPPRTVSDGLPGFSDEATGDPELSREEFLEQGRQTAIADDDPVVFHGRSAEDVSEFGRFGRDFEAPEGASELPGVFQSADLSRLRVSGVGGGLSLPRPGIPSANLRTARVLAEEDPDVGIIPSQFAGSGYAVRQGEELVDTGLTRSGANKLADEVGGRRVPDPTTPGFEFLTEEADLGRSYIRAEGDITPEQEAVAPPGAEFESAGLFGVRVGGRSIGPFTFGGEIVPGRLSRRVQDVDETDAGLDELLSGEAMAGETTRALREASERAEEPARLPTLFTTPVGEGVLGFDHPADRDGDEDLLESFDELDESLADVFDGAITSVVSSGAPVTEPVTLGGSIFGDTTVSDAAGGEPSIFGEPTATGGPVTEPTATGPPSTAPTTGPPTSLPPTFGPPATGPPTSGPPSTGPPSTGPPTSGPPSLFPGLPFGGPPGGPSRPAETVTDTDKEPPDEFMIFDIPFLNPIQTSGEVIRSEFDFGADTLQVSDLDGPEEVMDERVEETLWLNADDLVPI